MHISFSEASTVKLAPFAFTDPTEYLNSDETADYVDRYEQYFRGNLLDLGFNELRVNITRRHRLRYNFSRGLRKK